MHCPIPLATCLFLGRSRWTELPRCVSPAVSWYVSLLLIRLAYADIMRCLDVWTQGDFIRMDPATGGIQFLGRSDGVLNPSGENLPYPHHS